MSEDKATKRPWAVSMPKYSHYVEIVAESNDGLIATVGIEQGSEVMCHANASLIVRAVNEREKLVEALKELGLYAASLEMMLDIKTEGRPLALARQALAKGKE